jgi:diadenosine tetraphosphate (Ap4A) HIT family hydrolase
MGHMKNSTLYETAHWIVKLADDQYHLGRCIIDAKRDVGALKDLTYEEWSDLHANIIVKLEKAIIKSFGTEMFNWSCLMNNAYKKEIEKPAPHIHFHFRGRYRNPVKFAEEVFSDEEFGHHYNTAKTKKVSQKTFDKIAEEIRKNID